MLRFLVLDANPAEYRRRVAELGGRLGGELYCEVLLRLEPECTTDLAFPADSETPLPAGRALSEYDGIVWSGSTLTVHHSSDARVRRTVELARAAFEQAVPSYGSCYAAQLAVVTAGGQCTVNPKGREFGVAAPIDLTSDGLAHDFYSCRRRVTHGRSFVAFQSHQDIISSLPPESVVLASNSYASVQAVDVRYAGGSFWAVQYHPEWTFAELADVLELRGEAMAAEGFYSSPEEAVRVRHTYRDLAGSVEEPGPPDNQGMRAPWQDKPELFEFSLRTAETRSWIDNVVKPAAAPRRRVG